MTPDRRKSNGTALIEQKDPQAFVQDAHEVTSCGSVSGKTNLTVSILHVIPTVELSSGGPAEGVKQLCEIYLEHGGDVEVVSGDRAESLAAAKFPAPVHGIGPARGIYGYSPELLKWLRANAKRFDLIIINGIWQYVALAVYQALSGTSIPYGVFTHGMLDPYFEVRYPLKHIKKLIYWHIFLRKIMNKASAVFYTSEEEKVLARGSFPGFDVKEVVIPYGIYAPTCDLQSARESFLDKWPELRGKRLALFMSRIHPKKGIDLLIEAFSKSLAKAPEWQLVIAGPDQVGWKSRLEEQAVKLGIADRITWTGMIRNEVKWGAYAASEIFVLPSHQENFGIVVAEALACDLPVIISNKVNIWREVEGKLAGLICEDTAESTASALRKWAEMSTEEKDTMRKACQPCFNAHFNYRHTAEYIVKMMTQVARAKKS